MKKIVLLIVCLSALLAAGCQSTSGYRSTSTTNWPTAQANEIRAAGERLGVPVRTDRMVNLAQAGATLSTAPAANLETVPATELPRGVNFAVAYLDSPGQTVPRGYYALRAFADPQGPGEVPGRVQLINADGRVAGELPAVITVESMTVPSRSLTRFTEVAFSSSRLAGHCNPAYETCYCCPNGWIVCVSKLFVVNQNLVTAINN